MANKRKLQKIKTRENILAAAKTIFLEKGMLNTATSQIADAAEIAHGTLFLHFPTKDDLIINLLDKEMHNFSENIKIILSDDAELSTLLKQYLDLIQSEELFFSNLAKELPFYKSELRRKVLYRESIIREQFYKAIEKGISSGKYLNTDIAASLNFLFGTINYYLSLRSVFVNEESVIAKFKRSIVENFMRSIKNGGTE